jgi:serine/threonine protein kinase
MIDRYQLVQEIGEGGMGTVWVAEQFEPIQRKVALKVIKLGMDTREVVARFEAERQALAVMDHPHIAKVLDGGATGGGRPFFVMELVEGAPITQFCDEHRLPLRQRLELFSQVCEALQHAHQKGIIHRDIKPSNVLVSMQDGVPVPKVIDFGIAKATGGELGQNIAHTQQAQILGTPEYMAPEQSGMADLDIDTRADIYSLGVYCTRCRPVPSRSMSTRSSKRGTTRYFWGNENRSTLLAMNEMGDLLLKLGRSDEALVHFEEALAGQRRLLGDEHPDTLGTLGSLGELYSYAGEDEKAEALLRQAEQGARRALGNEHLGTLMKILNLAIVLKGQGKRSEAAALFREVHEGRRRVLGDDHPETQAALRELRSVSSAGPPPAARTEEVVVKGSEGAPGEVRSFEGLRAVPVELSDWFNKDIVFEGPAPGQSFLDTKGSRLVVASEEIQGLPPDGVVGVYQLEDYSKKNCLQLKSSDASRRSLQLPEGKVSALRFLILGSGGLSSIPVDVIHPDRRQRAQLQCPDWRTGDGSIIVLEGLAAHVLGSMEAAAGGRLYEQTLWLESEDAQAIELIPADAYFERPATRFHLLAVTAMVRP